MYFTLSATGIAALLVTSNLVFQTIKWIGVAYLLYLGVTAIFSKAGAFKIKADAKPQSSIQLFMQGFIIEIANPKALLYFSAILPQFLDINRPLGPQFLIMGCTTLMLDLAAYSSYAYLGYKLSHAGLKKWIVNTINRTAGVALIYAAAKMAMVNNKA